VVQLVRFTDEVDWGSFGLWVFLADLVAGAAVCAYPWAVAGAERVVPRPAAVR